MFSLTHSPLTGGLLSKFANLPSPGVHVVETRLRFVGLPIHALPRMPKRIGETLRTATVLDGRFTHDEWRRSERRRGEWASSFAVQKPLRKQSRKSGAYKYGKK